MTGLIRIMNTPVLVKDIGIYSVSRLRVQEYVEGEINKS